MFQALLTLSNFQRNIYLPVQQAVSSDGETGHKLSRGCVPLKKGLPIALWELETSSDYRSLGHLIGVSITVVCRCVQEFTVAAEILLILEQIRFLNQEKFYQLAAYRVLVLFTPFTPAIKLHFG